MILMKPCPRPLPPLQYQYFQGNTDVAIFRVGPLNLNLGSAIGIVSDVLPSLLSLPHRNIAAAAKMHPSLDSVCGDACWRES
jgi:hypothetical protein